MKVSLLVIAGVILIIIILFMLQSQISNAINYLKPIDKSCSKDGDCKMAQIDCSPCAFGSKGTAVNKNYKPLCPFKPRMYPCPQAVPEWASYEAVCERGKCVEKK